jgi:hypothetical protein
MKVFNLSQALTCAHYDIKWREAIELTNTDTYSIHFIFFIINEWAREARVFFPGKPFQPNVM